MVDRNNNGIDDSLEGLGDLADALGVEAPPPPQRTTAGGTSPSEDEVSRIFAGDIRVPLYDSGIGRESVGRIPIEQTREQALAEFGAFSDKDRRRLAKLAEAAGVDTKFSSLQWFWQQGVNNAEAAYAAGQRVSPWDYLESWASEPAARRASGVGPGAYSGPRTSVTMQAEPDIRELADAVSLEMIGRGVSEDEMAKILKRVRKAEVEQPTITTSRVAGTTTEQGLTAEGRRDIIENIIAKKPEYGEFQKATTLMSWFDRALQERLQG